VSKRKLLIFFPNNKVSGEYIELFPFNSLKGDFVFIRINGRKDQIFTDEIQLKLSLLTIKIHSLFHKSEMLRRRYSSVFYLARVRGYYPSKLDSEHIKLDFLNFKKAILLEKILVVIFGNLFGIYLLKKFLDLLFRFEATRNMKELSNIDTIVLPYTGGISAEWDYLTWFGNYKIIRTIGIQENWDNLSSKQFLYMKPDYFLTWGKQSSSHLRSIQNYRGIIKEVGCLRVQDFFRIRNLSSNSSNKKYSELDFSKKIILFIGMGDETSDLRLLKLISNHLESKSDPGLSNFEIIYRVHPHELMSPLRERNLSLIKSLNYIETFEPSLSETNNERINQLVKSDLVVSIFSTVILESSILNKSCIIPAFDLVTENYDSANLIDDINHFSGMSLLKGIRVAKTFKGFTNMLFEENKGNFMINDYDILKWFCADVDTKDEILNLILEKI